MATAHDVLGEQINIREQTHKKEITELILHFPHSQKKKSKKKVFTSVLVWAERSKAPSRHSLKNRVASSPRARVRCSERPSCTWQLSTWENRGEAGISSPTMHEVYGNICPWKNHQQFEGPEGHSHSNCWWRISHTIFFRKRGIWCCKESRQHKCHTGNMGALSPPRGVTV